MCPAGDPDSTSSSSAVETGAERSTDTTEGGPEGVDSLLRCDSEASDCRPGTPVPVPDGGTGFEAIRLEYPEDGVARIVLDRPDELNSVNYTVLAELDTRSWTTSKPTPTGIAIEAVPDDEFDARVAEGPTKAFGATKRLLTESFDRDLPSQLAAETEAIANATATEDYSRGHAAFLRKDDPAFTGR